jgi:hypothetical protein
MVVIRETDLNIVLEKLINIEISLKNWRKPNSEM